MMIEILKSLTQALKVIIKAFVKVLWEVLKRK